MLGHPIVAHRRLQGALLSLAIALTSPAAFPQSGDGSIDSGLEEQAAAWLSVVRLRVEQGRHAEIGECRALSPDDLVVTIQGEKLSGTESLSLDWNRPPTLHALVIDNSASMAPDLTYAKHAAKEYVKQLQPDREKGLIMTFDENVVLMLAPTEGRTAMLQTIDRVRNGSRTSMLDAIHYAVQELASHRERPVLILLSDGADTSSLHRVEEIETQVSNRPDLTVFTIGLGLRTGEGVKPTRQLLRRLAETTHGRFFDVAAGESLGKVFATIRDILDSEAILTVVDPDPRAGRERIRVESKNKNCGITVLDVSIDEPAPTPARQPIARPYPEPPQTYEVDLERTHYDALARSAERTVDPGCSAGRFFDLAFRDGQFRPKWFFHVGQRQTSACGPDVTMEFGRLYDPERETLFEHNDRLRLTARPFEVPIPPLEQLPGKPEEAFDQIAAQALTLADAEFPPESWRREGTGHASPFQDYPSLVHGMTFLGMRPVLARAHFLYPDYRAWVRNRLAEQADQELEILVERYRRQFPDHPAEVVEAAARESVEGRRIAATAETPSEVDLQPFLAAWLGDIPAHDLFVLWERRRIDRAIDGSPNWPVDERFAEAWREVRQVLFAPSYARVLTMLVPVHDRERDRIGFWRIVLPRPGWLAARVSGLIAGRDVTGDLLDLVPEQPLAWLVTERMLARSPELVRFLHDNGYRAADLRYELLGEPSGHTPQGAFAQCRVELAFRPEPSAATPESRSFGIRFDVVVNGSSEEPQLEFLAFDVQAAPGTLDGPMIEEIRLAARRVLSPDPPAAEPPAAVAAEASPAVPPVPRLAAAERPLPPPAPAVRERTTVVAVEVPVRALHDGEPYRGLTAADFELLDKGEEQTILAFDVVDLTTTGPGGTDDDATSLPRGARRNFLFFFDLAFSSPGALLRARRSVAGIIDRMHPTDEAAVAVYLPDQGSRLVAGFTTDRERIRHAVETLGLEASVSGPAEPAGPTAREGAAATSERDRDVQQHLESIRAGVQAGDRTARRAEIGALSRDLAGVARALSRVPGQKHVVYLSEGFDSSLLLAETDVDEQSRMGRAVEDGRIWEVAPDQRFGDAAAQSVFDAMLEEFRRADCVVHAVDIGAAASGRRARSGADGLSMLARGTGGGFYRDFNDLDRAVEKLLQETAFFYVLTFQPADLKSDGGYHRLRVRLKDAPRGVRLFHRPGYYSPVPREGAGEQGRLDP